jgi:hypothetical protein
MCVKTEARAKTIERKDTAEIRDNKRGNTDVDKKRGNRLKMGNMGREDDRIRTELVQD